MCGIVGAVAQRNIVPILVEGLQRLEYRGYDSCGVAVHAGRQAAARAQHRARGRAGRAGGDEQHRRRPPASPTPAGPRTARRRCTTRIRTSRRRTARRASRWCTTASSRTTTSCAPSCRRTGYEFDSQTDTEVIAHLVDQPVRRRPVRGRAAGACAQLHGAYAIAVFCRDEPQPRGRRARTARRWSLGVGRRARTSSRPTRWRWPASPTRSSTSRKATSSTCSSAGTGSSTRDGAAPVQRAGAHRAGAQRRRRARARTGTTCRRRSSSSRARSPTRSNAVGRHHARAVRRRRPYSVLQGDRPGADPGLRHQLLRRAASPSTGSKRSPACRRSVEIASEYRYRDSVPNPRTLVVDDLAERRDRRHAGGAEARASRSACSTR